MEKVNRNAVHARSSLLTSWLSESVGITKRDMQNMQSGGARGLELETTCYIMYHSLVRKRYNTVSKCTTIPGRNTGFLMLVYHSRSVCTTCMNALMTYSYLCEPGAQRYANTYVGKQVGKPIKTLGPSILIGRTFHGPTPSTEYGFTQINTFRPLNLMIDIGLWRDIKPA